MSRVTEDPSNQIAWYQPATADIVFLAVVLLALWLGENALLNDPGTTWHVRVGLDVMESGPPHVDAFSYPRQGHPWISQSWIFDVGLAAVYRAWSWNGVVVCSALLIGWVYRSLFRLVLQAPCNVAWSAVLTLLAAGCGASHWLARPHLLSLWFFVLTYRWCIEYHESGKRWVWAVPPLMVVWCNVHGGFLGGLVVIGCSLAGHLLNAPRHAAWLTRTFGFTVVFCASAIATFINPYGWKLYGHLGNLLYSSGVRELIDEWRSPDFQASDSHPLEILLLLAVALFAMARRRPSLFSLLHMLVWMHFALQAVRQVAFAAVIMARVLGEQTSELWHALRDRFGFTASWIETIGRRASEWGESERAARWPIASIGSTALFLGAVAFGVEWPAIRLGTAHFSAARWPIAAVERLNHEVTDGPLFNDLNWGGYLILHTDPPRPVFSDDRFELYGREFLEEYLDALNYGPAWHRLFDRYQFELVLIRPTAPLARVLRESADWEPLHADSTAILLRRRTGVRLARGLSD